MKSLVSGYSKTAVSHWRGCISQGFQSLQKVGKPTPEVDWKWPQHRWKSGSEGSPKRSLKLQGQIKRTWWKRSPKWGLKTCFFDYFSYCFEVWVQRCPRVVPGTLPGSLQGQNYFKTGLKMTPKSSTNVVRRLSENASQRHTH